MEGGGDAILGAPVCSVCKLQGVQGAWECGRDESFAQHFMMMEAGAIVDGSRSGRQWVWDVWTRG